MRHLIRRAIGAVLLQDDDADLAPDSCDCPACGFTLQTLYDVLTCCETPEGAHVVADLMAQTINLALGDIEAAAAAADDPTVAMLDLMYEAPAYGENGWSTDDLA